MVQVKCLICGWEGETEIKKKRVRSDGEVEIRWVDCPKCHSHIWSEVGDENG